eukprot:gnl/MRDRNA2_/MRDRNA2_74055_c0_seq1.p1 gnl/MRDRNA2_/MRDRNA2_74055_c0~~gnl/MRDRNA2_/MRDRNA2_74055_c0_seq1.p1  ORF type:complete len:111 (-),score=7.37 gnl/MRDRNA2_/MRDRNA2_74055_c0_seq1:97-429(-)
MRHASSRRRQICRKTLTYAEQGTRSITTPCWQCVSVQIAKPSRVFKKWQLHTQPELLFIIARQTTPCLQDAVVKNALGNNQGTTLAPVRNQTHSLNTFGHAPKAASPIKY